MITFLVLVTWLLCFVAFGLGIIVAIRPIPNWRLSRRWHGGALMGGAFVMFWAAGLVLGATSAPEAALTVATEVAESTAAPTVALADPAITAAVPYEDMLAVTARIDGEDSDKDYMFQVGQLVQAVARAVQGGATDVGHATEVDISVSAGAMDRLGEPHQVHVVTLTLNVDNLRKARLENLSVGRTLNLADDIRFGDIGARQLSAYCLSDRGLEQSQQFCRLAAEKASN